MNISWSTLWLIWSVSSGLVRSSLSLSPPFQYRRIPLTFTFFLQLLDSTGCQVTAIPEDKEGVRSAISISVFSVCSVCVLRVFFVCSVCVLRVYPVRTRTSVYLTHTLVPVPRTLGIFPHEGRRLLHSHVHQTFHNHHCPASKTGLPSHSWKELATTVHFLWKGKGKGSSLYGTGRHFCKRLTFYPVPVQDVVSLDSGIAATEEWETQTHTQPRECEFFTFFICRWIL